MGENASKKPFMFRRRFERVDWRKLASANLDHIARDLDFQALQENLTNIAFCNIELELDLRLVDPNFVKLFRLAQLTIEYLLYSQDYLSETILSLEARIKDQNKNEQNLIEKASTLEKECEKLKKEGHKRKKLLVDQQHLIDAGAENFHKCLLCAKAFMNATFLQNHCMRRHGQTFQEIKSAHDSEKENEAPAKILEQIEEIRERLILTESQLAEERRTLKDLSLKESDLLAQRDSEHRKEMDQWQKLKESQHKEEIEKIQNALMNELREMHEKFSASQQALEASHQTLYKQSYVGASIRDEREDSEIELLRQQIKTLQQEIQTEQQRNRDLLAKSDALLDQPDGKSVGDNSLREKINELEEQVRLTSELRSKDKKSLKNKELKIQELQAQNERIMLQLENTNKKAKDSTDKRRTLTFADDNVEVLTKKADKVKKPEPKTQQAMDGQERRENSAPKQPASGPSQTIQNPDVATSAEVYTSLGSDQPSDEEETTEAEVTSTLGTGSLSITGTLDFSEKSRRLRDVLSSNPQMIIDMKQKLRQSLNEELSRRGISNDDIGLSTKMFETKRQHLNQERKGLERKYKRFTEIRNSLIKTINEQALSGRSGDQTIGGDSTLRTTRNGTATMSSMNATTDSNSWGTSSSKWTASDRKEMVQDMSSDTEGEDGSEPESERNLGSKQPASLAKQKQSSISAQSSQPLKQSSTSAQSSQPLKQSSASAQSSQPLKQSSTSAQSSQPLKQSSSSVTTTQLQKQPASGGQGDTKYQEKQPTIKVPAAGADSGDSDWDDDMSELKEVEPQAKQSTLKQSSASTGSTLQSPMIKSIAANIETQLMQRKGKAPAGGVDVLDASKNKGLMALQSKSPTTPEIPQIDDDEDDESFLSSDDDKQATKSANTYTSKQWGQGSTALNTLSSKQGIQTSDKAPSVASDASFTSVTGTEQKGDSGSDWSNESDFENL